MQSDIFSGHKLFGPSGVGVLYGKAEHLEAMPPYQGGGEMILSVTFEETVYNEIPHKFEAGTPDIAGVVGLGAAIDYVEALGLDAIAAHEHELLEYATGALSEVPGLTLVGTAPRRPRSFPSCSTAPIPTTSVRSSTSRASPSAPAITAPSP